MDEHSDQATPLTQSNYAVRPPGPRRPSCNFVGGPSSDHVPQSPSHSVERHHLPIETTSHEARISIDEKRFMSKRPRRRTIYIPDDTTIMTIHPGRQERSDIHHDEVYKIGVSGDHPSPIQAQETRLQERSRATRRSSFAMAPKRVALVPTLATLQESTNTHASLPPALGKENVATIETREADLAKACHGKPRRASFLIAAHHSARPPSRPSGGGTHTAAMMPAYEEEQSRLHSQETHARNGSLGLCESSFQKRKSLHSTDGAAKKRNITKAPEAHRKNGLRKPTKLQSSCDVPSSAAHNMLTATFGNHKWPVSCADDILLTKSLALSHVLSFASEDVDSAQTCEDVWLRQQEIAITQILNRLFHKKQHSYQKITCHPEMRRIFLQLQQNSQYLIVRKRIQASLAFGGLRPPQSSLAECTRLHSDLKLRHSFVTFWLETYDICMLGAAAEVVVGHERTMPNDCTKGKVLSRNLDLSKKSVGDLIKHALLQVESTFACGRLCSPLERWQQIMLNSLMLIYLLDQAKVTNSLRNNLFLRSAQAKSSSEALQQFKLLFLPNSPVNLFAHLGFEVAHVQRPCEEFVYEIRSLATDMRDGVRLARLVEILRHALSAKQPNPISTCKDYAVTCSLSSRLSIPCNGRSQRIHNVKLSMDAINGPKGTLLFRPEAYAPEDIVDGHREKTVSLLWNLVSYGGGLPLLVDYNDLEREIKRLKKLSVSEHGKVNIPDSGVQYSRLAQRTTLRRHEAALTDWATAVAVVRGAPLCDSSINGLSGSQLFTAIIDEYERFLPSPSNSRPGSSGICAELSDRLRQLGCSRPFAELFTNERAIAVLDERFKIAALAYLSSRLLSLSRKGRAACTIFWTYRCRRLRQHGGERGDRQSSPAPRPGKTDRDPTVSAVKVLQRARRKNAFDQAGREIELQDAENQRYIAPIDLPTPKCLEDIWLGQA